MESSNVKNEANTLSVAYLGFAQDRSPPVGVQRPLVGGAEALFVM